MPTLARASSRFSKSDLKVACSSCGLRELCLPVGFTPDEMTRLDGLVAHKMSVRRGDPLYRAGETFIAFYAVRTGFFKTRTTSAEGREHVSGFQMAGELLGLDGISGDRHTCDAIALEDSQVCVIPYANLERLSREFNELQRQFHRIMGREIVREHGVMLLLGSMKAEQRLAAFLLNLSQRLEARGFSPTALVLRMTREDIGTYLGLKLETVSRCFSRFQDEGLLLVRHKQVEILSAQGLQDLVDGRTTHAERALAVAHAE